jgi:hypothetical protein
LQRESRVAEPEGSPVTRPPFLASGTETLQPGDGDVIRSELLAFRGNAKRSENAVVIAREWPSCLFILPGMGFDKIHVFTSTLMRDAIDDACLALSIYFS